MQSTLTSSEGVERVSKRAKHSKDDEEAVTTTQHPLITCSKGRQFVDSNKAAPKEYVVHLPPRLTKSAYQTVSDFDGC